MSTATSSSGFLDIIGQATPPALVNVTARYAVQRASAMHGSFPAGVPVDHAPSYR
ncbi:hypothetical protein [Rhizomonospora bruguierae]|uniref:hypothetical protein n=1 Tax=Rhizomonospora bruguierae TaxID=1581705 RepID=UPI001BD07A5A|nr:hypothetical protein [Micromonospora sp. NBRC 107566]